MAQIKIYGTAEAIKPVQRLFSDRLHSCLVDALKLPEDKRFHRLKTPKSNWGIRVVPGDELALNYPDHLT